MKLEKQLEGFLKIKGTWLHEDFQPQALGCLYPSPSCFAGGTGYQRCLHIFILVTSPMVAIVYLHIFFKTNGLFYTTFS